MRNWYVGNVDNVDIDYIWWSRWIFFLFTIMRMMRNWHFDNDHIYETMMMNWFYDTIGLIYYPFPLYKTQFERVYLLTRWEKGRGLSLSSSPNIIFYHATILSCHRFIIPRGLAIIIIIIFTINHILSCHLMLHQCNTIITVIKHLILHTYHQNKYLTNATYLTFVKNLSPME